MSRRQLGQMLTAGALRGILPAGVLSVDETDRLTQTIAHPHRVDQQVIDYFRRLLAEHYTSNKMLGPRQLLGPVAMYWSDRATQWAQSAVDYQMVAYLLIRKSNIACLADDATTAVDLASVAGNTALVPTVSWSVGPSGRLCRLTVAHGGPAPVHPVQVTLGTRRP